MKKKKILYTHTCSSILYIHVVKKKKKKKILYTHTCSSILYLHVVKKKKKKMDEGG